MNKLLIAAAIAGACVAAPASAQWYIGGGVGRSEVKVSSASPAAGVNVNGGSGTDTSAKILGGYQFTPVWGIEAQYADLGRSNYTVTQGAASAQGTARAEQFSVAGTGTWSLSNNFYLMGKLGVSNNRVRVGTACVPAGCVTSGNGSRSDLLAGVGVGYNFTKNWGVRFEYENFGRMFKNNNGGSNGRGDNWALSVKYAF